jgi:hypothetical protein
VRGRSDHRSFNDGNDHYKSKKAEDIQSPDRPRSFVSIAKSKHILLMSVGN